MRLSICIPTHNGRGKFLKEAIDSILPQITPPLREQVQICISDNASEDETQTLIADYNCSFPGVLLYRRNSENLGFTRNLMRAISLAEGDYCWMFSSDDTLPSQALARILALLEKHPNLTGMTVNVQSHDNQMNPLGKGAYLASLMPENPKQMQIFTSPDQIFRNCGSVQGYTSGQIFDRRLWQESVADMSEEKFVSFHYFPYLYTFGCMVKKRPSWMWIPEYLVNNRTNNDYLSIHMNMNALKYHTLTMEEASRVWADLFGRLSATYQILMYDNFINFWAGRNLIYYKGLYVCTTTDEVKALIWFVRRMYFAPRFWLTAFPVLLTPRLILRAGVAILLKLGYKRKTPIRQIVSESPTTGDAVF